MENTSNEIIQLKKVAREVNGAGQSIFSTVVLKSINTSMKWFKTLPKLNIDNF